MNFKLISYNVAGLPLYLNLNDLPWYLKFITWIYKLIKKTTIIPLNIEGPGEEGTKLLALLLMNYDIIGLNEDFNYHNIFKNIMQDKFNFGTWLGGLELSKFTKLINFHWNRLPSFNIDGLCLITNKDRIKVISETRIKWDKCYGYLSNANDALMDKGFRKYVINLDNVLNIDLYILHMDADFYNLNPDINGDIEARKSLLLLLSKYIIGNSTNNPIIIMGDFNSNYMWQWDKDNVLNNFIDKINLVSGLFIKEVFPNEIDIDKIFYINNLNSPYLIEPVNCYFDHNFVSLNGLNLSDHNPIIAEFKYIYRAT